MRTEARGRRTNLRGKRSYWLAATFLLPSFVNSAPADADTDPQASDAALPEVLVTAQKRSERLQDVPIAVTALTGDALASKGLTSTLDIAAAIPGLTYTQVTGTASPRIRGIGTASALAGNENSVATYVDGVYYASSASSVLSLVNVAQVAVLKGPQGTLFGRNATGGLIQITTLDPKQDFSGTVTASYGNDDTIGSTMYVTGGLSPALAADLSVYFNDQKEGFGRNLTTGTEVNKANDSAIRSKWLLNIGEATTLKLSGDYGSVDSAAPPRRLTYGSRPSIGVPFTGDPFDVDSNIDAVYEDRQYGSSVDLTHHFSTFDFVSLTAYREATTHVLIDTDGTPVSSSDTNNVFKERQLTQETQLISTGGGALSWTAGAYYFAGTGGYDSVILHVPGAVQLFQSYQHTKSPAAYGQATYKFTEATSLTLGARYSEETRHLDAHGSILETAPGVTVTPSPLLGKLSVEKPTWRVALDHRLNPDVLVYASYNRGFKSGGYNAAVFYGKPQTFNPETLDAYEVGIKSDWFDRRLRVNGAAFYYDYSDIQLTSYGSVGIPIISNASNAKIDGMDLDLTARATDNLTITAGLSYIHSRFGNFPNSQVSIPLAAGGNLITSGNATGNSLPYTPDWTIDVGLDYEMPLRRGSLQYSTHYFHSDGWFAEPDNRLRQNPYNLLSASLAWYMDNAKRASLTAWGKNLTNAVVAEQLQSRNTGDVVTVGAGRTFGATLGYKF